MLGMGGLSLPNLLRAEAAAGINSSTKSVIFIYLVGGPPHQDMFDLKPDAPKEIAGPWKPIATAPRCLDRWRVLKILVPDKVLSWS
jgi:hypothetical protein